MVKVLKYISKSLYSYLEAGFWLAAQSAVQWVFERKKRFLWGIFTTGGLLLLTFLLYGLKHPRFVWDGWVHLKGGGVCWYLLWKIMFILIVRWSVYSVHITTPRFVSLCVQCQHEKLWGLQRMCLSSFSWLFYPQLFEDLSEQVLTGLQLFSY